jgi:hypothetical protein
MQIFANTPDEYVEQIPVERKAIFNELRKTFRENLPDGFEETTGYGMMGYVVPHSLYPNGYHTDPRQPLPFMGLASQKNFIGFYHMGLYTNKELLDWFRGEYTKHSKSRLDMGKSCIRFKKIDQIPVKLLGELAAKITVQEWISHYESYFKNRHSRGSH